MIHGGEKPIRGISDYYRNLDSDRRGFSTRNVWCFYKIRGITRISETEVATFVGPEAVVQRYSV